MSVIESNVDASSDEFRQNLARMRTLQEDLGQRLRTAREARTRRARALHEEALAIAEAGGFDVEASYAVRNLAGHKQDAGDLDGALAGFERSLALREKAGLRSTSRRR
jgi:hypothetical protein